MPTFYYDRQDLRHGNAFAEFDYQNIDPRTYFRSLKRDIQEVTVGNSYKYAVQEPDGENPAVTPENVGSRAGRIQGRLVARTNWEKFAGGQTQEESSPIGAIIAGVIGALLVIGGLALRGTAQGAVIGLGIIVLLVAGLLYYLNEPNVKQNEYYFRKRVRILARGEVAEHAASESDPADVVASDLSVICSEDIEIEYRNATGSQRVSREELPPDVQSRLDTGYTTLTEEIDFQSPAEEVYLDRVA